MPNDTRGSRNPKRLLNAHRIAVLFLLTLILVTQFVQSFKLSDVSERSFAPITVEQADKVKTAASFLVTAGFTHPVYLGITPGIEGKYPTFRVEAIGGQTVDVFIRTTKNGGLQIQPTVIFHSIGSADDFARLAADAVSRWENKPPSIQPRTDGSSGEYESLKYDYDKLSKYKAPYGLVNNETSGWPQK